MRVQSYPKPRSDGYVDEYVSDKATMMNNDNDDSEKKMDGMGCDELGWRGCNMFDRVSHK